MENEPICSKIVPDESDQDNLESRKLWTNLTKFLKLRDYNAASLAKAKVEETQRQLAKLRIESGISWHPKFFKYHSDGFWHFIDHKFVTESKEVLTDHLLEVMLRRDFNFKPDNSI